MVSAIGSFYAPVAAPVSVASTAGLEAQIARDEKELSNCVNCASAETKQGQADIQALTNKISIAKARLEQVSSANQTEQTGASAPQIAFEAKVAEVAGHANAAAPNPQSNNDPVVSQNASTSGVGRLVDEYA